MLFMKAPFCSRTNLVERTQTSTAYAISCAISETARMPSSTSSTVLKCEKLKRTAPCEAVPSASCMSGAQWAPERVQMPNRVLRALLTRA